MENGGAGALPEDGPGALPEGNEVHVWHGRVTVAAAPDARDLAVLSAAERDRSERLRRPGDGARFAAAHAGARRLLAGYLGADPAAIRLGRTPCCKCGNTEHGRPRIDWPPTSLSHNLSHSGEHWLLAVAVGRPVGVDLECPRELNVDRMSAACLSPAERAYLGSQPPQQRLLVFYRCWTRKEAVLKACGVGLATRLESLEVHPEQCGTAEVRHRSGACPDLWAVQDLPGGPDWAGAVAQPAGRVGPIRFRPYDSGAA